MSQLPGNFNSNGIPIPQVDVKPVAGTPVAVAPIESPDQNKGWFGSLFTNFGNDFAASTASHQSQPTESTGASSGFDFRSLVSQGEKSDQTSQLLLQLFVFIGLMVIVLFAFKFFKK